MSVNNCSNKTTSYSYNIILNTMKREYIMSSKQGFQIEYDKLLEKLIKESTFIGKGHNGVVYKLINGKVIKIFKDPKKCKEEYQTLKRASKVSKVFPKVYLQKTNYIIRDYVDGIRLDQYLKENKLNKLLFMNLFKLIEEFKKANFTRLDIRCKDVYIQKDLSLIVIDPKHQYTKIISYPRHLMKGLNNLGVLNEFLTYLNYYNKEYYKLWNKKFNLYKNEHIK